MPKLTSLIYTVILTILLTVILLILAGCAVLFFGSQHWSQVAAGVVEERGLADWIRGNVS